MGLDRLDLAGIEPVIERPGKACLVGAIADHDSFNGKLAALAEPTEFRRTLADTSATYPPLATGRPFSRGP